MDKEKATEMAEGLLKLTYYVTLVDSYELTTLGWTFGGFKPLNKATAHCNLRSKQIVIDENRLQFLSSKQVRNTLLHEIAHAIDFEMRGISAHDEHFNNIAVQIGCNPKEHVNVTELGIKHGADVFAADKYTVVCDSCGPIAGMNRMPKRVYRCGRCGGSVRLKTNSNAN
jgi:predicted SprT family Zn-dependent metalloprotease